MYRHPCLRPLSRGHQPILMHARDLRWRATALERDKRDLHTHAFPDYREYVASALEAHLRAEEEHLLPLLAGHADSGHADSGRADSGLAAAVAEDRAARDALRAAVLEVTEETVEGLRRLGDALERHARHCERQLFPAAERVLDETTLAGIERAVGVYKI